MKDAETALGAYARRAMAGRRPSKGTSVFGKRLAAVRQDRGLTQNQLAKRLGISQTMVAYYENQSPSPTVDIAQRCAQALDVPLEQLVDENRSLRRVKPGPRSNFEERLEQIKKMPRRQQELVLSMLDAAIKTVEQR